MPDLAYVNGTFSPIDQAVVPLNDRGFYFADSVYEGIPVYGARPFRLDAHLRRLRESLEAVRLGYAFDAPGLTGAIDEIIARSGIAEGFLYIQITRGAAPRELAFPKNTPPLVVMTLKATKPKPEAWRTAGVTVITVEDDRWRWNHVKSTCRLPNVLAKQRAVEASAYEAVFVSGEGELLEGTHTNFFAVSGGDVRTAPLGSQLLAGITREVIAEVCRDAGIRFREEPIPASALPSLEECFVTGSATEVLPVVRVDDQVIGAGRPGPVTMRIMKGYADCVEAFRAATAPS